MRVTFAEIDRSDLAILEMSEKGVGLGIEAGYVIAIVNTQPTPVVG